MTELTIINIFLALQIIISSPSIIMSWRIYFGKCPQCGEKRHQ